MWVLWCFFSVTFCHTHHVRRSVSQPRVRGPPSGPCCNWKGSVNMKYSLKKIIVICHMTFIEIALFHSSVTKNKTTDGKRTFFFFNCICFKSVILNLVSIVSMKLHSYCLRLLMTIENSLVFLVDGPTWLHEKVRAQEIMKSSTKIWLANFKWHK